MTSEDQERTIRDLVVAVDTLRSAVAELCDYLYHRDKPRDIGEYDTDLRALEQTILRIPRPRPTPR